jgi:hypothetical protein
MQSSTPLPYEVLENEETCIAYIHFSSVGYRKFCPLIWVLTISIPSREYIKTSNGEWEAGQGQVQMVAYGPLFQGFGEGTRWS